MVYKLYGSISSIRKLKDVIQKGNLNNTKLHILHLLANTTKRENTIENTIEQFIAAKEKMGMMGEIVADCLWLLGIETDRVDKGYFAPDSKALFSSLVQELIHANIVSKQIILERLDENSLATCGLIEDLKLFQRKKTRLNTKNNYEQRKYNLLREESEGFAKVIAELNQRFDEDSLENVFENIKSLIGYFNLDPNRVLDIMIDHFEQDSSNLLYIKLISKFNINALPALLGFKFKSHREQCDEDQMANSEQNVPENKPVETHSLIPAKLYQVAAQLIKHRLCKLQDLWVYLEPSDEVMKKQMNYKFELAFKIYRKATVVSLAAAINPEIRENEQQELEGYIEIIKNEDLRNEKLWLMESLVSVNAFAEVETIFHVMGDNLDIGMNSSLLRTLHDILHWVIEPTYEEISFTKVTGIPRSPIRQFPLDTTPNKMLGLNYSTTSFKIVIQESLRVLKILGIYLVQDTILFTKMCRLLKYAFKEKVYYENFEIIVEKILVSTILPALTMKKGNPGLAYDVWSVLKRFSVERRYIIYFNWLRGSKFSHPRVILENGNTTKETLQWAKRLSWDNLKLFGKLIAKISHSNPLVVFEMVLTNVRVYDNQIQALVLALSFCSPLTLDGIAFIILYLISNQNKQNINVDGTIASWLLNLAAIAGQFFKRYPKTDVSGILLYLCNKLKDGKSQEIIVLSELLAKMSGWSIIEVRNLTQHQIEAMGGGQLLRRESTMAVNDAKRVKVPSHILGNVFWHRKNQENLKFKAKQKTQYLSEQHLKKIQSKTTKSSSLGSRSSHSKRNSQILEKKVKPEKLNSEKLETSSAEESPNEKLTDRLNYNYESIELHQGGQHEMKTPMSMACALQALICQNLESVVYTTDTEDPKLLGTLHDRLHKYLIQFMDFLNFHSNGPQHYCELLPNNPLKALTHEMRLTPEQAFAMVRPSLKPLPQYNNEELNLLVADAKFVMDSYIKNQQSYVFESMEKSSFIHEKSYIHERFADVWNTISPELYALFWLTGYGDIWTPVDSYKREIDRIQKECDGMLEQIKYEEKGNINSLQKKIDRFTNLVANLKVEQEQRVKITESYIDMFRNIKDRLLPTVEQKYDNQFVETFIQLVRAIFTAIQCCTEDEAYYMGTFFRELCHILNNWTPRTEFVKICYNTPGFSRKIGVNDPFEYQEFLNFKNVFYHYITDTIVKCLSSDDFMQSRNALIILKILIELYPNTQTQIERIGKRLEIILAEKKWEDLFTMAESIKEMIGKRSIGLNPDTLEEKQSSNKEYREVIFSVYEERDKVKEKQKDKDKDQDKEKVQRKFMNISLDERISGRTERPDRIELRGERVDSRQERGEITDNRSEKPRKLGEKRPRSRSRSPDRHRGRVKRPKFEEEYPPKESKESREYRHSSTTKDYRPKY